MKHIHTLLVIVASLALATACDRGSGDQSQSSSGGGDGSGGQRTVGFSQIGAESGWRTAETDSIKSEAEKRNIDFKLSDAQQKQENQITALRSFIRQRVHAIILAPVIKTGWEPVFKEAQAAKIPIILVDRGVTADESLYATFIASDFVDEGRRAGEWVANKLGGKGNIVELQGTPGADPAIDRKKGFEQAITKHPNLKIIKSQSGEFTRAKGKEVMEAFIKSEGKNINAVFAHNDDMALGAIQAIEEAGMKPGSEILVVSIDGIKPALEAIVAGKLNCSVECNPLLGPAAFDAVEKALKGESLQKKVVIQDQLFDSNNAAAALPDRKY
jgi:galactofuranose transport system substrate-binding protein